LANVKDIVVVVLIRWNINAQCIAKKNQCRLVTLWGHEREQQRY